MYCESDFHNLAQQPTCFAVSAQAAPAESTSPNEREQLIW